MASFWTFHLLSMNCSSLQTALPPSDFGSGSRPEIDSNQFSYFQFLPVASRIGSTDQGSGSTPFAFSGSFIISTTLSGSSLTLLSSSRRKAIATKKQLSSEPDGFSFEGVFDGILGFWDTCLGMILRGNIFVFLNCSSYIVHFIDNSRCQVLLT